MSDPTDSGVRTTVGLTLEPSSRELETPPEWTGARPDRTSLDHAPHTEEGTDPIDEEIIWEDEEFEEEAVDSPQSGPCSLFLRAEWQSSGEFADTWAILYRLDAPGNEFFGPGDQVQLGMHLPAEGLWIHDLPEDDYRAICVGASADAEDPPAFAVSGAETRHMLRIAKPHEARGTLRLYRSNGTEITEAIQGPVRNPPYRDMQIPWLTKREQLRGYSETSISIGDSAYLPERRTAGIDGFSLGRLREATRGGPWGYLTSYTQDGWSKVRIAAQWTPDEGTEWCGVLAPMDEIVGSLGLASGAPLDVDKLRVVATCTAVRSDQLETSSPWTELEIEVQAAYPGHEPLEFTWRASDGPPAWRTLSSAQ